LADTALWSWWKRHGGDSGNSSLTAAAGRQRELDICGGDGSTTTTASVTATRCRHPPLTPCCRHRRTLPPPATATLLPPPPPSCCHRLAATATAAPPRCRHRSIDNRDAGGTRRSYPVPPRPAQGAAPLIFCGVVSAVAPLALPRSHKGGSQFQQTRHSAENQKWGILERFGGVNGGKFGKRRQYQFHLVELTCGAFGTDQNLAPYIKRRESQRETQLSVL
jgi:hypothetical protein